MPYCNSNVNSISMSSELHVIVSFQHMLLQTVLYIYCIKDSLKFNSFSFWNNGIFKFILKSENYRKQLDKHKNTRIDYKPRNDKDEK